MVSQFGELCSSDNPLSHTKNFHFHLWLRYLKHILILHYMLSFIDINDLASTYLLN